jgi:ribosomal protein S18 acetylase RimI-like enzyme
LRANSKLDVFVRPLHDADAGDVVVLYDRATATEPTIGPVPREAWERFVRSPQNRNGRDFRVALWDGRSVGLAESSHRDQGDRSVRYCKLVVDPEFRRKGIGAALLADLLEINREDSEISFQATASTEWSAGLAFLAKFGFAHIEPEIGMRCSRLGVRPAAKPLPVSLERVSDPARRAADVARIHNAAYRSDADFRRFTAGEIADYLAGGVLWIARDASNVVAFCFLEFGPDLTRLESLAADPDRQARGIGSALAWTALEAAGVDGGRPAALNVSSKNLRARALYERLGFKAAREKLRFSALRSDLVAAMAERNK